MRKYWLTALILPLFVTACSAAPHINTQEAISAACPSIPTYTAAEQCEMRQEILALDKSGIDYHLVQKALVDSKVMRDQSRVCRGLKIPIPKNNCPKL